LFSASGTLRPGIQPEDRLRVVVIDEVPCTATAELKRVAQVNTIAKPNPTSRHIA
jgi:hypothetical protein